MRLCTVGDNVVDRYVDRGVMYPGGNAVNVAVFGRRCGADTSYVGAIGSDRAGELVLRSLRAEGVGTERTRVVDGPNAYAVVQVVDGDRVFGDASVGVSRFELAPVDLSHLRSFDLVHTGDCSMVEAQVADMATAGRLSFDFSVQPRSYAEPLLPHVDVATFSASGATDDEVRDLLDWAHAHGPRYVVVTRGAAGAVVSDGDVVHHEPPAAVGVVDTLGAGDGYIAGFLTSLGSGHDLVRAAADGAASAAKVCGAFGAFGYETPDLKVLRTAPATRLGDDIQREPAPSTQEQ